MANNTGIEWTDSTWSPLRVRVKPDAAEIARKKGYDSLVQIAERMAGHAGPHCEHVSPGCENCYAETNNHRCLPANGTGLPYDRRSRDLVDSFVDEKILLQPLRWKPILQNDGTALPGSDLARKPPYRPRRIFVGNQTDIFGEWYTDEMLDRIFAVMAITPHHVYQVLTKRPERMRSYLASDASLGRILREVDALARALGGRGTSFVTEAQDGLKGLQLPNVWLGVSVENQAAANARIVHLLKTPAAVRFVSAEPLLGAVELDDIVVQDGPGEWHFSCLDDDGSIEDDEDFHGAKVDWVICGGESGSGARPMHPDWARSLRDQCVAAGVPFFFKQWGEWIAGAQHIHYSDDARFMRIDRDGRAVSDLSGLWDASDGMMYREGKKAAGAKLDGREWREFPGVRQ
jgi:protein gp37